MSDTDEPCGTVYADPWRRCTKPPEYEVEWSNGNVVPLCTDCATRVRAQYAPPQLVSLRSAPRKRTTT